MGEKYVTNAAVVLGSVVHDLTTGEATAGPVLRDLADQATKLGGVAETFADIALSQFPAIYAAATSQIAPKIQAVEIEAEKP